MRDGRVEPQEAETYLKQYVETARGEPARLPCQHHGQACRSGVCAVAVESFMNNAGLGGANRKQTNGVVSPVKLKSRHAQKEHPHEKSIPMIGAVLRASFFLLSGLMLGFAFLLVASQGSFSLAQVTPAITPTTGAGNWARR